MPTAQGDKTARITPGNSSPFHLSVGRRSFVKRLVIAGAAVTGGYALFEYAPWLNYDLQAGRTWQPFAKETAVSAQMHELVRYATLAASGHNTQPWKFAIKANEIEIHPDYARRLQAVDPGDRELWISLGARGASVRTHGA